MKTIVGLFDNMDQARQAALDVESAGVAHSDISVVANNEGGRHVPTDAAGGAGTSGSAEDTGSAIGHDAVKGAGIGGVAGLLLGLTGLAIPGLGWIAGAGWLMGMLLGAGTGAVVGGLVGALTHAGVPEEDAARYNEGVRGGGVLVAVKAEDALASRVAQILNRDGASDVDERGSTASAPASTSAATARTDFLPTPGAPAAAAASAPSTAYSATTTTPSTAATTSAPLSGGTTTVNAGEHVAIPVVEEELQVGKREVEQGGARIHTSVTETPVQEQVTLREEHVTVERRPVNRPVGEADMSTFREETVELTERAEVPVVSKEARVVEEVVVGKETTERTETVRDTVRRTDVDVDELNTTDTSVTNTVPRTDANTKR